MSRVDTDSAVHHHSVELAEYELRWGFWSSDHHRDAGLPRKVMKEGAEPIPTTTFEYHHYNGGC